MDPFSYPHVKENALDIKWKDRVFANPPFSKIKKFLSKIFEEHANGIDIMLLCKQSFAYRPEFNDFKKIELGRIVFIHPVYCEYSSAAKFDTTTVHLKMHDLKEENI